jgi:nitrate/nitrite-specific signal transduction histidine kinase
VHLTYTKEEVAIIIVLLDLIIVFIFWLSLLVVKPLEKLTTDEIRQGVLTASDFTVVVK